MNTHNNNLSPSYIQKEYEDPWNKLHIDLEALKSNYRNLKAQLPPGTVFYAVLKSDAYGHGLAETGRALSQSGCMHFAVESPQEGIRLRNEGITGEILLMNPIPLWMAELSVRYDLSVSVIHHSILQPLEDAAQMLGKICRIHLNVNVGLNRLGVAPSKIMAIAKEAAQKPHIELEGMFGQPRDSLSAVQSFKRLQQIYEKLKSEDVAPTYLHFANSTTFLMHPQAIADGVRLGILLYGVLPPEQFGKKSAPIELTPVMSLESELVQIRRLPKGSKIGYRSSENTKHDLIVGTIPLGYYHGLDRKMVKNSYVLIREKRAPFIGAISMNSSTVDITEIVDASIGDAATIIGRQGDHIIDINELAESADTIAAELMIRFGNTIAKNYFVKSRNMIREISVEQGKRDDIRIQYFQTENELPEWLSVFDIIYFLQTHLVPFDDPKNIISVAVDYALSAHPGGKGFILLAILNEKVLGVLVCVRMNNVAIIPENLLVYVCVHRSYRGKGLGSRLILEAINCTDGDIKVHVDRANPAIKLFKNLGFKNDYVEMRFLKGAI